MDTTYHSSFYEKDFVEDTLSKESLQNYSRSILSKSGGGSFSKLVCDRFYRRAPIKNLRR